MSKKLRFLLLFALLVGCGEVGRPAIQVFTASSTSVVPNTAVTLSWQAIGFDTLTLTPSVGDVSSLRSAVVQPVETTIYTLTATRGGVQETRSLEVRVGSPPTIQSFTASPNPVSPGQPATLTWLVEGATTLEIDRGIGSVTGQTSAEVTATEDATYTLTARNDFGSATRSLTLEVGDGPTIHSFAITPDRLTAPGGAATLSWRVTGEGTVRVSINQGVGSVAASGTRQVSVTSSKTYTLTATDARGTRTASTTVVVGNPPTLEFWTTLSGTLAEGESATLRWQVSGQEITSLRIEPEVGDIPVTELSGSRRVTPAATTTYTFTAQNPFGSTSKQVEIRVRPSLPEGNITLLIAGQSNATGQGELTSPEPAIPQVRMLGNDYVWKTATEAVDSNEGQIDAVSRDSNPGHSFGVRLGKQLFEATGKQIYLIPAARGGSCVTSACGNGAPSWQPVGATDRSTLFGSAVYRAKVSNGTANNPPAGPEGGDITGILWYQGETDSNSSEGRSGFIVNTSTVMNGFRQQLGNKPIVYVQLGVRLGNEPDNQRYQFIRERQRKMESVYGEGENRLQNFYMVVAHDLPMVDNNHLSAAGQKELGDRIALAYQQHVLGFDVDGTGPRLRSIELETDTMIKLSTTSPELSQDAQNNGYSGYFTVYVNNTALEFGSFQVARHPTDRSAIRITLPAPQSGTVSITYAPPSASSRSQRVDNVVRDARSGLPLPTFGDTVSFNTGRVGLPVGYAADAP